MQNNFKPATQKQKDLLIKKGYDGNVDDLSMEEASQIINAYMLEDAQKAAINSQPNDIFNGNDVEPFPYDAKPQPEVKPQPKQEVAKAQPNQVAVPKTFSSWMEKIGSKVVARTILDEKRRNQFVANIVSAVASNPMLQECAQDTILSAALQADALHFPVNNALGYCYLVPYNDKKRGVKVAQFQIGYKGYIQMAIRSGQYLNIDVAEVKEGELLEHNPMRCKIKWNQNYKERKNLKTVGYVGEFTLVNGFTKSLYMDYDEMMDHANTYSQAFDADIFQKLLNNKIPEKDMWKYSSYWYKDFDEMAKKTVIRQLLSKWGIMSVEMQEAFQNDMASFDVAGNRNYIDAVSKEFENGNIGDVNNQQLSQNGSITPDIDIKADDLE